MENTYLKKFESELKTLMSTKSGRRLFLQAAPLLLASCATTEQTRYREGDNSGQAVSLDPSQERQMTAKVLPKMKQDYPAVQNSGMQRYINNIGQNIVRANNLQQNPYTYNFTVVDTAAINAFALPAGTVFITAPLIAMAGSEAELAGVIGHEIGHIQARHSAERMFTQQKSQKSSMLFAIGGAALGGLLGAGVGKLTCRKQDRECLKRAATYGAMAGAGGGLLITKYKFMANSREDEMEADRIGFRTSHNAGYDKDHVGLFYNKLLVMEKQRKAGGSNNILAGFADALSTHPPSQERVNQMNQMAREASGKGKVSSSAFTQYKTFSKQVAARAQAKAKTQSR